MVAAMRLEWVAAFVGIRTQQRTAILWLNFALQQTD
jgi:hypothetical protein